MNMNEDERVSECSCKEDILVPLEEYIVLRDKRLELLGRIFGGFIVLKGHNHKNRKVVAETEHCQLLKRDNGE